MCGILGVFGELEDDDSIYNEMLTSMEHRGPDSRGFAKGERFCLGHQRLSIVDVEKGRQPIQHKDSNINLVCNGEIYNHLSLRNQIDTNYPFVTDSDSEVIIPLYKELNFQSVNDLDGMFSFILSDGNNYFVARDPIGIKPLYWGRDDRHVYFSSEIKALINHADIIEEFPKGCCYHSKKGLIQYYRLPEIDTFIMNVDVAVEKIKESLANSVRKRLMSDVPIGVFLSGGLDSSIIAALMKDDISDLHSFSVGFEGSPDLKAARLVADHLGTIHHEYVYSESEMLEVVSDVIYYLESFDPALVRSAVPCYFVSKLASQYVKVVLTGEGADELFAGYSYFSDFAEPQSLQAESKRVINSLHNTNLQRVDRMTMAHGLEGRVPFLDVGFIESVLKISPYLKSQKTFGVEKWLLRKAFEDRLPDDIVWRDKMEFAQGCGSSTVFEQKAEGITRLEKQEAIDQSYPVSSKEELYYYNMFKTYFDHPDSINLVGRWKGKMH